MQKIWNLLLKSGANPNSNFTNHNRGYQNAICIYLNCMIKVLNLQEIKEITSYSISSVTEYNSLEIIMLHIETFFNSISKCLIIQCKLYKYQIHLVIDSLSCTERGSCRPINNALMTHTINNFYVH